jgi:aminomethyltransferase
LWEALTGAGAVPYGLAAVETLRIESGLIFIGYDYFQHETNPYDMSLDKVIRLDAGDFSGKAALVETAQSPPRRFVTLAVDSGDVPEYGAAVTSGGEPAGTLTSPCESPDARPRDRDGGAGGRFAEPGTRVEVALAEGTAPATVESLPV